MFYLQNPLKILLITVAVLFVTTAGNAQQSVPKKAPKKALPDFKFENKLYRVDCYDKTKGGCEQLIELLKSFQKPKERDTPKLWNEHIKSAEAQT
jgi:hypothetical protein